MKRSYDTLGRRILRMLAEGGPRKRTVLEGIAGSDARLRPVLKRLLDAGRVSMTQCNGGALIALLPQPKKGIR